MDYNKADAGNFDLRGRTVLIVEEGPTATELRTLVEFHNGRAIGPLPRIAGGLAMLKAVKINVAVVDGDMPNSMSLIYRLALSQIPCLVKASVAPETQSYLAFCPVVFLAKSIEASETLLTLKIALGW